MIDLPKYITKCVYRIKSNSVWRCYSEEAISLDNADRDTIVSKAPFIVEQEGRKFVLTSSRNMMIPDDCAYGLLINRQLSSASYSRGDFEIKEWLKHPAINDALSPDEVAKSWRGQFTFAQEDKDADIPGLREPQLAAIHAYLSKKYDLRDRANIVMPTGTGKTETMLGIMVSAQCKKILVTVPHDALREQIFRKFMTMGCLQQFGIVVQGCNYPYVAIVNNGMKLDEWREIVSRSNVIVSTMPLLAKAGEEIWSYLASEITTVFVDEAHHTEAKTWSMFLESFPSNHIIQFTATPFRNDGRKLRGEFIYTFSLRSAQRQGYYQRINFDPVYEIDKEKADETIARKAVEILRRDLSSGYDHILMARCRDKQRADQVFEKYRLFSDLNPVVIYSGKPEHQTLLDEVKRGEHKIVVCVNMLGEGFDLPQLKVAAIHDEKQSLPITLQFIGRFTRTQGNSIGEASFVTNMAYPPLANDIKDLYLKDADWNVIIPGLNDNTTGEEVAFAELLNDFPHLDKSEIPFQSINPALSTVIYQLDHMGWNADNWKSVFTDSDYDYRYQDVNETGDMMVIILGRMESLDWSSFEGLQNRTWNVVLLYKYDAGNYKHLYINSSLRGASFDKLVESLFGTKQTLLSGPNVFRSFHGLRRILVQNFGGRKAFQGDISFKSYFGRDVENGLSEATLGRLHQNNIFASGILNGERITHGCSMKGKIWSYRRGNLLSFKNWARRIGALVENPTIPTDELFKHALKVTPVGSCPRQVPVGIDWDNDVYRNMDANQILKFDGLDQNVYIFDASLEITQREWSHEALPSDVLFEISYGSARTQYRISYSAVPDGEVTKYGYEIERIQGPKISFQINQIGYDDIIDYFNSEQRSPVLFFADGSMLYANNLVTLRQVITPFNSNDLIVYDWHGVDLRVESMDWPHRQNSIQYYVWQQINNDYELVFDDDGSGEIADLIGVKQNANTIYVDFYHLKYAVDGSVTQRIANFYEVCGQAQKSLKWKNADKDVFRRMIERVTRTQKGENRILKGDMDLLKQLSQDAMRLKKTVVGLHIVQPGLSKANAPIDILQLLGVVKNYAFEVCNASLKVYCSE